MVITNAPRTEHTAIEALRRLFLAEHACPTGRLAQTMPYVPLGDSAEKAALADVIREDQQHQMWLAQLLIERGTAPPPGTYQNMAAGMHFQRLAALVPLLVHAERALIAAYESESGNLSQDEVASRRVMEIMQRHQRHLALFERLRQTT